MDAASLRSEFPVLERYTYLNAGTDGPLPSRAIAAMSRELDRELREGRAQAHFERRFELAAKLRSAYATLLGCDARDVALTTSTSEGMAHVVAGIELEAGDEIVTSDEEHPGLQGALAAARDVRGAVIKEVPLADVADAVTPRTRLVACCHVGWMSGSLAPEALAEVDVPVLLDGAQGVGAVPVDVRRLGCDAYAGAGQKWLCGPDGTGMLYVGTDLRERLAVMRRGYVNLADPGTGLAGAVHADARCFDTPALGAESLAGALEAVELLAQTGWETVLGRARSFASRLAEQLREQGRPPAPRDETTLVSFPSEDPVGERARLAAEGIVVRNIPGRPWLRASVGAWNDDGDLDRLLRALSV